MKKSIFPILLLLAVLTACERNDPEPEPEPKRAYCILYNFLMTDAVIWEVAGVELPDPIEYGERFLGAVILNEETENIPFIVKTTSLGQTLKSQVIPLSENAYYQIVICGTLEEPELLIMEEPDSYPASGLISFQFLQAASDLDTLDVYMGGTDPEDKVVSSIGYREFADIFTVDDMVARQATSVVPAGDAYDPDSVLIDYMYDEPAQSQASYLVVIAHEDTQFTSDLALFLFSHTYH